MTPLQRYPLLFLLLPFVFSSCGGALKKAPHPNEPSITGYSDIIPLTESNLRGHKMLYDEGWFVVSSSKKALAYARNKAFTTSGDNMRKIAASVVEHSGEFGHQVTENTEKSYELAKHTLEFGTDVSRFGLAVTSLLAEDELKLARNAFDEACTAFVDGHISLVKRTPEDLKRLKSVPGTYFQNLKEDFSNIHDLYASVNSKVSEKIGLSWEKSFDEAAASFQAEYEESGKRGNSLTALGDILSGYLKAFYQGIARPSAKALVQGSGKGANSLIFLPGAAASVVAGRTLEATGLALFYTGETGYHIIAPTIESGYLAGVSMLSLAAVPVSVAGGVTLSAVNQVAFTAAAPVVGAGKAVATTVRDTGKYVALVGYDLSSQSTSVAINYAKSGVVLGYNALSAIPVHLFLGTVDTAVFLAYDGPRLVIAAARGELKPSVRGTAISVGALPTGAVVDLGKLEKEAGVKVDILTDDPSVINRVLENMPKDLKREP